MLFSQELIAQANEKIRAAIDSGVKPFSISIGNGTCQLARITRTGTVVTVSRKLRPDELLAAIDEYTTR